MFVISSILFGLILLTMYLIVLFFDECGYIFRFLFFKYTSECIKDSNYIAWLLLIEMPLQIMSHYIIYLRYLGLFVFV